MSSASLAYGRAVPICAIRLCRAPAHAVLALTRCVHTALPRSQHVAWVDTSNLLGGAAAFCCLLGYRQRMCAFVMLGDTFIDSYLLIQRIFLQYVYGRGLYINELMAKKFSLVRMLIRPAHTEEVLPACA